MAHVKLLNPFLLIKLGVILSILSAFRNLSSIYYLILISLYFIIFLNVIRRPLAQGFIASVFYLFSFFSIGVIAWSGIYMQNWDFLPGVPRILFMPVLTFLIFTQVDKITDISKLLKIVLICYVIGALSIVYQIIFGPISWFAPQFYRADLDRYASILGSLTIYGAIAGYSLVLIYSNSILKCRLILRMALFFIIIVAAFFSLSKAATVMILLATLIYLFFDFKSLIKRVSFKDILFFLFLLIVGFVLLFQINEFRQYYNVIVTQTIGGSSILSDGTGVKIDSQAVTLEHIYKRLFYWTSSMLETYGEMVYFFGVGLQGGAGTMGVSPEIGDYGSSHNSLGDLFFMGGPFYLIIFLVIYFYTQYVLFLSRNDSLSKLFFMLNLLFFANLLVASGSIFHPAISFIFWLSIIYANLKSKLIFSHQN